MPTFRVKARKKTALVIGDVEASTRDEAIALIVASAAPGEEVEVWDVEDISAMLGPTGATGATGVTGATGPTGMAMVAFSWDAATGATGPTGSGPAGRLAGPPMGPIGSAAPDTRPTRAQLNEMSKDELVATAEAEGAEVNHSWTKADIVDAIMKHRR